MQLVPIRLDEAPCIGAFMYEHYSTTFSYLWNDGGAWYLHNRFSEPRLKTMLTETTAQVNPAMVLWIVEPTGMRVGWTLWEAKPAPLRSDVGAKLTRLYVCNAAKNRGFGSHVMQQFEAWALTNSHSYRWLEALTQGRSRHFYEQHGYRATAQRSLEYSALVASYRSITTFVHPG